MELKKISKLREFYHTHILENVIPFWMRSDLLDKKYGGFITSVDREGRLYNSDKSVWFQGRCLWTFSRLCRQYGQRPEWVEAAKSGANFIKRYGIDPADGRMYFTLTREGEPLRKRRYFFSESFLVLGFAEYYSAFGEAADLALAEKYFENMYCIYRNPASDPFKITPKENAKVRSTHSCADSMVLLNAAQALRRVNPLRASYYDERIAEVVQDILTLHYKEEHRCVLETVNRDGSILDNPAGRTINPGHSIENAWFLMNHANITQNSVLLEKALNILKWSLDWGWDKEYGGLLYFADMSHRPCEQLEYDMKLWWVHNEALIATLVAASLTDDPVYETWYDKLHTYTFGHFPDREYGEWYGYLHRDGSVSHTQKGSLWKGPYHLPRCLMLCETILSAAEKHEKLPSLI